MLAPGTAARMTLCAHPCDSPSGAGWNLATQHQDFIHPDGTRACGQYPGWRFKPQTSVRTCPANGAATPGGQPRFFMTSRIRSAVADGVLPTLTPAASRASFLAAAVPEEPDTMAPAWPMVLPSGAVKPAT